MQKKLLILFTILFSSHLFAFPSTGNGSDGACVFAGGTFAKATWNCTTVSVTGAMDAAGINQPIVILAQQKVTIDSSVNISGGNGLAASAAGPVINSIAQAKGWAGGNSSTPGVGPGNDGLGPVANSAGKGGTESTDLAGDPGAGGGGGGAIHGTNPPPTDGQDGGATGLPTPGTGGLAGTASYNPETTFEISLTGGSGGGAGGSGNSSGGPGHFGGAGGAGGGAIRIISSEEIVISASGSIISNGGDGGSAAGLYAGAGGGGAGGAIFLQSLKQIHIDGQLRALGGTGGAANLSGGGAGGNGGSGRIRLDDADGEVTGDIQPSAYLLRSSSKKKHTDTITCGTITDIGSGTPPWGNLISTLLGFMLMILFSQSQKIKLIPIQR